MTNEIQTILNPYEGSLPSSDNPNLIIKPIMSRITDTIVILTKYPSVCVCHN